MMMMIMMVTIGWSDARPHEDANDADSADEHDAADSDDATPGDRRHGQSQ